jgi:hypothetical protein
MSDIDKSELENILYIARVNWQTSPDEIFDKGVTANAKQAIEALITQQCNQARIALLNDLKQVTFNAVMSDKDAHGAIEDYIAAELAQAKETEGA